jgi:hypothetical protein
MFCKTLFISLLTAISFQAKAQFMHFDPIPVAPQQSNGIPNTTPTDNNVQTIDAYLVNPQTQEVQKVKLKIAITQYSILVTGFKKLTDYTWMDFTLPLQATKVYSGSELAKYFEHEVYIPALQTKIYF